MAQGQKSLTMVCQPSLLTIILCEVPISNLIILLITIFQGRWLLNACSRRYILFGAQFNSTHNFTQSGYSKVGYVDAMPLFRSQHLALNSPLSYFNGDNARLSTRRTKLTVTPKFISSNGNMAFAKLWRTQSLTCPTTCAAFLNLLITPFCLLTHYETCSTNANYILNKNYSKNILTIGILLLHPSFIYPISFSKITLQT